MSKSRRSSSSRSRNTSSRAPTTSACSGTTSTKPAKLGISFAALKKFLARSLERDDIDPVLDPTRDRAVHPTRDLEFDPALVPAFRDALDVARGHEDIDYGPAISAVHDLAAWAFDIAERDVRGWREAERRVRNARRFVLARIRGYRARRVPYEDVLFTAGLLVRIFDDDLSLGMSEMVSIFDVLGLPTEVVPLRPRNASGASAMRPAPAPRSPVAPIAARRPPPVSAVAPGPLSCCDECGQVRAPMWPHLRNAA